MLLLLLLRTVTRDGRNGGSSTSVTVFTWSGVFCEFLCFFFDGLVDRRIREIVVSSTFVRLAVLGILQQNLINVCACILDKLIVRVEYYQCDFTVT